MAKHQACISTVIDGMENEEKGMLKCVLFYGKKLQEEAGKIVNSPEELRKYGENVTGDWVSEQLEDIFTEGVGLTDKFQDISYNYGKQLDVTINDVLVTSLKVTKPMFSKDAGTVEGAIQREGWIAEKLMDSLITNMDEDARKELVNQIGKMLMEKGIDAGKAARASAAILTGGLTAARAILGFNFHILIAQIANLIVKLLVGRGLTLAANAALQRVFGILFGPIGWIITAIMALPLITTLINPRGYEKFIPAVFIIGVTRLSQNDGNEKYDQAEFLKKALGALSELKQFPESPNFNIKMEVLDADAGVFWEDIKIVNGWKLQRNNLFKYLRILDPNKVQIAYGNEEEIAKYLDNVIALKYDERSAA
jgi:uncharacterized protein YaaW (UPF0174 family)